MKSSMPESVKKIMKIVDGDKDLAIIGVHLKYGTFAAIRSDSMRAAIVEVGEIEKKMMELKREMYAVKFIQQISEKQKDTPHVQDYFG